MSITVRHGWKNNEDRAKWLLCLSFHELSTIIKRLSDVRDDIQRKLKSVGVTVG